MIDHITLGVKDVDIAKKFYDAVLETLGYKCVAKENADGLGIVAAGYGKKNAFFWICLPLDHEVSKAQPSNGSHIAFKAGSEEKVIAFFDAALENGGTDEGAPGLRPQYHDNYYAAFVRDPEGHKIEVVYGNSK